MAKAKTGIRGFDEITYGGLPKGRTTLVCGGAGCGKTLFGLEFLVRGITEYGEPGVFLAFEETRVDLAANVASMGFDLAGLEEKQQLIVDHIDISGSDIDEAGDYDLEALFVRLGYAIDAVGARRVAIDTVDVLFSVFANAAVVRAELRRLFAWLKDRGITAIVTGERGELSLTRFGIEEYVSDCVVVLDHRIDAEVSTRRLRVAKYRGSVHGTNEYPFLIGTRGLSVLPITSLGLAHEAQTERISTGNAGLDGMLDGHGPFRGSSVLVSGTPGSGKTTLAAGFAAAACARGERALYIGFEESESQVVRNLRSVGLDLSPFIDSGHLQFDCVRPSSFGLELHLAAIEELIEQFAPTVVVIDPISNLIRSGTPAQVSSMLTREIDYLKSRGITCLLTSLTSEPRSNEDGLSSLMDTWLLIQTIARQGQRERTVQVIKSRGMAHSSEIRELAITGEGISVGGRFGHESLVTSGTS